MAGTQILCRFPPKHFLQQGGIIAVRYERERSDLPLDAAHEIAALPDLIGAGALAPRDIDCIPAGEVDAGGCLTMLRERGEPRLQSQHVIEIERIEPACSE